MTFCCEYIMFHTSLSSKHVTEHDHNTHSFGWGSSATRAETAPAGHYVQREGLLGDLQH